MEKRIREIAKRMTRKLGLEGSVVKAFDSKEPRIFYSEDQGGMFQGILYWLDNDERFVEKKNEIEKESGASVWHAVMSHTYIGDMLAFLLIKDERDERDLGEGKAFAYVWNMSDPDLSEYGYVGVRGVNGGASRTW